jgi:hypothetical protein
MTDRRIIIHVTAAILSAKAAKDDGKLSTPDIAQIACDAYEEAREAIPSFDQPTRFTVKGRGVFPADMLRHDHCYPVDGDINCITNPALTTGVNKDHVAEIVLVAQSGRRITPARWQSFGWVVTEIDGVPTHG